MHRLWISKDWIRIWALPRHVRIHSFIHPTTQSGHMLGPRHTKMSEDVVAVLKNVTSVGGDP